jgi:hypothetical protein
VIYCVFARKLNDKQSYGQRRESFVKVPFESGSGLSQIGLVYFGIGRYWLQFASRPRRK